MPWQHPLDPSSITDRFGDTEPPRTSPHRGLDYAPGSRKLIGSVSEATVTNIFWSDCLGWICETRTDEHGLYVSYCHLFCNKHNTVNCDGSDHEDGSTCMSQLKIGDRVDAGQWVGRVGNSGSCSRGSHLHLVFSKKPDARFAKVFDPEKFIDQKIAKQNKQKRAPKVRVGDLGKRLGRFWTLKK